jgi:uroporphyrinogen-III decarboxylase
LWDEFFKPRYKRIFDAVHAAGWQVWMHSCGKVNEIIDSLIDIGVDVLNLQQPRALGIEEIGRRFAGRVCFSTLCDIQHTLPFASDEDVRKEAKLLIDHWATKEGGLFICDYGDGRAIGVSAERKKLMFEAFREFDPWKS